MPDNSLARQFWGRVPFTFCGAFLYFSKGSRVQSLLHQLKYNNRPEVGLKLGHLYGKQLSSALSSFLPDVIVPVPLHPKRQKKRGYNQSEYFARGLSETMHIPIDTSTLQRGAFTSSQTKKSRFLRYENMKDVFFLSKAEEFEGKHILLVDDIITTGATIESSAIPIHEVPATKISIAGIAYTN
ncbi:ComF family protein [Desertivirga brevis]|uniref:ComF family protein n=1 Tax=Desertivirga brevis TaxID=2810310 RepID=UPI001F616F93|nr:phosphoribosyltransferase family protein [Pedobacter sp. SYSU D00873]